MRVIVIEPPDPVVTTAEAKKHLRVEHDEDDDYIDGLIAAATAWLDGPAGWLGRALGLQTLELIHDDFGYGSCVIRLPYPPIVDILSVKYVASDGMVTTWPSDSYISDREWLSPAYGMSWPTVRRQSDAFRIQYRAGYGSFDTADPPVWKPALPKPIWVAILMLVSQFYQNREPVVIGATVETLPFAVEALLSPYRIF